jgi:indole-3-glycerol phosphate synthase
MSDFLAEMAKGSRERAASIGRRFLDSTFDLPVAPLAFTTFDLIAEVKERSPAEGLLVGRLPSGETRGSHGDRALQYVQGGAAAISVLTEPSRFDGSLEHLAEVVRAVTGAGVPVMRKDFLVDRRQILEARAAGASGVLLIVAMLNDKELPDLLACAREHSLFVLLEAFDERDLERIRALLENGRCADDAANRTLLVGINVRDLRTLAVDSGRLARLAPLLPEGAVCVAESGLASPSDAATAASLGYHMGLVGTALMRAANPAALLSDMLLAGRASTAG